MMSNNKESVVAKFVASRLEEVYKYDPINERWKSLLVGDFIYEMYVIQDLIKILDGNPEKCFPDGYGWRDVQDVYILVRVLLTEGYKNKKDA